MFGRGTSTNVPETAAPSLLKITRGNRKLFQSISFWEFQQEARLPTKPISLFIEEMNN